MRCKIEKKTHFCVIYRPLLTTISVTFEQLLVYIKAKTVFNLDEESVKDGTSKVT